MAPTASTRLLPRILPAAGRDVFLFAVCGSLFSHHSQVEGGWHAAFSTRSQPTRDHCPAGDEFSVAAQGTEAVGCDLNISISEPGRAISKQTDSTRSLPKRVHNELVVTDRKFQRRRGGRSLVQMFLFTYGRYISINLFRMGTA